MELQVNGRAVHAYTGGKPLDPARATVTFIHGALHDHSGWTLLARWCAHHGHNALALDLPGHLRSSGPPLNSIGELADWVLAVLDAAGVKQSALVGHSMGSLIALEAAARAPARVNRLVLLGTAYPMKVAPALLETALKTPQVAINMVNAWSYSSTAAKPSFPGPGMWLQGANRALMRRAQAGCTSTNLFHHEFSLCDQYAHGLQAAQAVRCPVHFVLGTEDQMTPPKGAEELGRTLKAQVHRVAAGHNMAQEAPDEVLAALRCALGRPFGGCVPTRLERDDHAQGAAGAFNASLGVGTAHFQVAVDTLVQLGIGKHLVGAALGVGVPGQLRADEEARADFEPLLAQALEDGLATNAVVAQSLPQGRGLWHLRESIPLAQAQDGHNIKHDIALPISAIAAFVQETDALLTRALPDARLVNFGHLGDGNLHYNVQGPVGDGGRAYLQAHEQQAHRIVYDQVQRFGGSFSAEHGIGSLKKHPALLPFFFQAGPRPGAAPIEAPTARPGRHAARPAVRAPPPGTD
ncbi:hypothetical protein B566_EDAN018344 [Ephemera danica]|nr:hypothetical protein B566_EDAN018344 [Ephemera danica]